MDEAKLHLGDRAEHSQDHAAHRAAGIDGRLQHPKACASLFEFVHEVEDVPSVSAQAVQLDHDEGIAGANVGYLGLGPVTIASAVDSTVSTPPLLHETMWYCT